MSPEILIPIIWTLGTLVTARIVYGKARASLVDRYHQQGDRNPVARFNRYERPQQAVGAVLAGLAFPAVVTAVVVYWVVTHQPKPSQYETKKKAEAQEKRIKELESELYDK